MRFGGRLALSLPLTHSQSLFSTGISKVCAVPVCAFVQIRANYSHGQIQLSARLCELSSVGTQPHPAILSGWFHNCISSQLWPQSLHGAKACHTYSGPSQKTQASPGVDEESLFNCAK